MPLPFADSAAMRLDALDNYRAEIKGLQEQFAGQIEILLALEFDYLPDYPDWTREILERGWDLRPASVHFTRIKLDGKPCIIDGEEGFERALQDIFKGDIRAFCGHYYELVGALARTGRFDRVNHFDLIKKFNADSRYFDDRADWYRDLVERALQAIAAAGLALEINTAGLDKPVAEPYPADWVLARCRTLGIPIEINSDAHRPAEIGRHFDLIESHFV
jgi:histidinol-phosphatase (PHP family)